MNLYLCFLANRSVNENKNDGTIKTTYDVSKTPSGNMYLEKNLQQLVLKSDGHQPEKAISN
jgi:hypothetical protein